MIRKRVTYAELCLICLIRGTDPNSYELQSGRKKYRASLSDDENSIITGKHGIVELSDGKSIKVHFEDNEDISVHFNGSYTIFPRDKFVFAESKKQEIKTPATKEEKSKDARIYELEKILDIKANSNVEVYDLTPAQNSEHSKSQSVAIFLLSDTHIEEVVDAQTVLGLNEYNPEIAKQRMDAFFVNAAKLTSHAQRSYNIDEVTLGCLGDIIGNWIHEELMQTNAMSPLEAISAAKSMILSGLKYWHDNMNVSKITFVGVVGNHGRTTKKSQFANSTDVSLEYFMYKDIEEMARVLGLHKIKFVIPKSEMAVVSIFGKRMLFTHGTNIKYGGGVGGLIIPVTRWFMRLSSTLKVDIAFLGHFHQSVYTKKFVVNGSIKGYDGYAFGKGLDYEAPQQTMLVLNEKRGFTSYTPIYLE